MKVKELLADSLLRLCEMMPLESITIQQLLEDTALSRQSFYNHFIDKNDLIQYIYRTRMIPCYEKETLVEDFYASLLDSFQRMKQHQSFMMQACKMEGPNCLKDYMFDHCKEYDLSWHQRYYGNTPMSEALRFATEYHAMASSSMTLSWILSGMAVSCEEMAKLITEMRGIGMDALFAQASGNPYQKK